MNYVKHLDFNNIEVKEIPCIRGSGAPSTNTDGAVGCLYMNTATGHIYKCTKASGGTYTWEDLNADVREEISQLSSEKVDKAEVATMIEAGVEDEKGNIVQLLIAELQGLPIFGVIDENNIVTVTSLLADGTYKLKYENTDGTTTEIGIITVGDGTGNGSNGDGSGDNGNTGGNTGGDTGDTEITNWIPESVTIDDKHFVGTNGEDGYTTNYRISSSGAESSGDGINMCTTGYIKIASGSTVYIKNITVDGSNVGYIAVYDSSKTFSMVYGITAQFTEDENGVLSKTLTAPGMGYIRLCAGVIDETSILRINNPIE